MRINKTLSTKRETYVYTSFSQDPPMSVAEIQANLKNPANDMGGKEMSAKRIYEIKKLVSNKAPLPEKVFTRKAKATLQRSGGKPSRLGKVLRFLHWS